jgi:catechol 2,3-dioxygenase-like lactoylglutathione lyase family enzyme
MAASFNPLGHISIGVRSYEASKTFYDAALAPLGLRLVYDSVTTAPGTPRASTTPHTSPTPRILGYGPDEDNELLNIFEVGNSAVAPGPGCHIALNALSCQDVRDFHEAAVRCGGKSNGEPGLRPHYGSSYYAAFVVDPDGWRLEAVCKTENESELS